MILINFFNSEHNKKEGASSPEPETLNIQLKWSLNKSDLVELIYGLYEVKAFGNNTDIKFLATTFEKLFAIDLGTYYRTWQDIQARKMNQTVFIDQLKEKLKSRIEENAEK